ncbi:AMP-binding protein [Thalassotalea nanhaiensis]|uniref:AMP-binding protein n=1 Tax=Thalassotalea nanhaiensis TaxID=3065648 RepID=A0ABY9TFH0_9GAMM|nr:AMP-binding protein [Colwelliaceae bacterium SQ345]
MTKKFDLYRTFKMSIGLLEKGEIMKTALLVDRLEQYSQAEFKVDVAATLQAKANEYSTQVALSGHLLGGEINVEDQFTYAELSEEVKQFSKLLLAKGVRRSDRIALLSEARPHWAIAFLAILSCGAIVVPVDPQLTEVELLLILNDAKPKALIASTHMFTTGVTLQKQLNTINFVIELECYKAHLTTLESSVTSFSKYHHRVKLNSKAVICYTSGTTGKFKGVEITYRNIVGQVENLNRLMKTDGAEVCVSILPLHHLLELSAGLLGVLWGGGHVCYLNSLIPEDLLKTMRTQNATFLIAVPLFLSLMKKSILQKVAQQPKAKQLLFKALFHTSRYLPTIVRKRLFHQIHQQFGDKFKHFVCGGAPLDKATLQFFTNLGFTIYQGYGMTETSPVISANTPYKNRYGSVGKPLPGCEVKIDKKNQLDTYAVGEILTRGHHVMAGYFDDQTLTAQTIDPQGWLHTGDLGYIDKKGFLYVTGRKKNTIVLADGQNLQPEQIEPQLFAHPDIKEGCVVALTANKGINKGRLQVCAVVVASDELIAELNQNKHALEHRLTDIIEQKSETLARWKRPNIVIVLSQDLPRSTTRKIKRIQVEQIVQQHAQQKEVE